MLQRPGWIKKPLASYGKLPWLLAVHYRRFERRLCWVFGNQRFAATRCDQRLPFRIKKHQSVLIRKLGDSDIRLQENKIENLKIVIRCLSGIQIYPGETFSFCKQVGKPTAHRGFKPGMELVRGKARPGIGGGICQASNLIYWLVLHSPLTVLERHHHSFDPFPDNGRVLPFASGATVMYNYRDLQFRNDTPHTFQINLWMDKKCLNGELRSGVRPKWSYSVFEKNHRFIRRQSKVFRTNELWRKVMDIQQGGQIIRKEFIVRNFAEVKYAI